LQRLNNKNGTKEGRNIQKGVVPTHSTQSAAKAKKIKQKGPGPSIAQAPPDQGGKKQVTMLLGQETKADQTEKKGRRTSTTDHGGNGNPCN